VGIILFAVGVVGLAITLIATSTASRGAVVERDRQVVIDRDQPPY
jgi:hypothetical protein